MAKTQSTMSSLPLKLERENEGIRVYNKDNKSGFLIYKHRGRYENKKGMIVEYGMEKGKEILGILPFKINRQGQMEYMPRFTERSKRPVHDVIRVPYDTVPELIEKILQLIGYGEKEMKKIKKKEGVTDKDIKECLG